MKERGVAVIIQLQMVPLDNYSLRKELINLLLIMKKKKQIWKYISMLLHGLL